MSEPIECPTCGRVNDMHPSTEGGPRRPETGDVGICWNCRCPYLYVRRPSGLHGRLPTPGELAEILAIPEFRRTLHAMTESYAPKEALDLLRPDGWDTP